MRITLTALTFAFMCAGGVTAEAQSARREIIVAIPDSFPLDSKHINPHTVEALITRFGDAQLVLLNPEFATAQTLGAAVRVAKQVRDKPPREPTDRILVGHPGKPPKAGPSALDVQRFASLRAQPRGGIEGFGNARFIHINE